MIVYDKVTHNMTVLNNVVLIVALKLIAAERNIALCSLVNYNNYVEVSVSFDYFPFLRK